MGNKNQEEKEWINDGNNNKWCVMEGMASTNK